MIKLLFIIWDGTLGGIQENLGDFLRNTSPDRYQVTICLLSKSGSIINRFKAPNIKVVEMKAKSGLDILAFFRFLKFLCLNHFDLIHNNTRTFFGHLALALGAYKTPRLYQEHGEIHTYGDSFKTSLAYRLFSYFYSLFITVSDDTSHSMQSVGIPKEKIVNIYNPIDYRRFNNIFSRDEAKRMLGIHPGTFIVGTACRFVHQKDLPLFLKTAKRINQVLPDVHFVLAGGGIEEQNLRILANALDIKSVVHFVGIRTDMPIVFRSFDIFLFTSYQEPFGRTILECLSSGTPIVAIVPDYGGGKELIEQAKGIVYTYERSYEKLSELTINLLNSSEKRKLMGDLGRNWVLNKSEFHVDVWIRRVEEVYSRLVKVEKGTFKAQSEKRKKL